MVDRVYSFADRLGSAISSGIMALAALTCVVISGYFNFLFGYGWGPTHYEAIGLGAVFVALDVLKCYLPGKIAQAWRNRHPLYAIGGKIAFVLLVTLSISSAIGFYSQARSTKTADTRSNVEQVASLRREISGINVRLRGYQSTDTPGQLSAKLAGMRTNRRWGSTKGCSDKETTASKSRAFCAEYRGIEGKLSLAKIIAEDRTAIASKRAELRRLIDGGGLKPVNPQAETIAGIVNWFAAPPQGEKPKVSADQVEFALRLALPIIVEIGAAFGFFLAFGHGGANPARNRQKPPENGTLVDVTPPRKNPDTSSIPRFSSSTSLIGNDMLECDKNGKPIIEGSLI